MTGIIKDAELQSLELVNEPSDHYALYAVPVSVKESLKVKVSNFPKHFAHAIYCLQFNLI